MPSRLVLLIAAPLLVVGCRSEPSFEERYQDQNAKLLSAANGMQEELSSRLSAASAAQRNAIGTDEDPPANEASVP